MTARPTSIRTYNKKRDFSRTPEPAGKKAASKAGPLRYVVQMHSATRLHYDFRLEADGVLKSWAVPKGPSLDPDDKRLAVQVEDHPVSYGGFEGIIPKGNYGAGEVILWDRGKYMPRVPGSISRQIAAGELKFVLLGEKLRGGFTLVRIHAKDGADNAWLLIKEDDKFVDRRWSAAAHDESVKSGKTLADMKKSSHVRKWISDRKSRRS